MDDQSGDSRKLDVLTSRVGILERLREAPAYKRDLVDDLDHSRSTINRAIGDLEDVDLVERQDDGFAATVAGRLALDRLQAFQAELDDIVAAEAVLDPLPFDAPIDTRAVAGSDALLSTDPAPYRPLERFHDDLADANRYRALLPALDDPRHVRLLYEHVVTEDRPAELIVAPELFRTLRSEFPRRMAAMAERDGFRVLVADVPQFALGLVDSGADSGTTAHVVVFTESGGVHGVLVNGTATAVRWADDLYAEIEADAAERTDALFADADGGTPAVDVDGGVARAAIGRTLSVALEREGFLQLDVPYFREEPVADPTTAWRAGLTLPEVHTGYAVDRTLGDVDLDEDDAERRDMTAAITADLEAGTDCVVVGPPGSGKSTICKRVACEWYDADRGPVLYREGGRGRPFESVDDLVVTVDAADGHTLVVVEDAVRSDADAVFDAIARLSDREDVSFLLDAREHEWWDPPGDPRDVPGIEVVTMPPLGDRDAERLVEHFERTVGETVGVAVDRLQAEIHEEAVTGEDAAPDEVLLLLHRLATYADPLADEQTSLEATVAAVYDDLAGDDVALDVCVLANALNAAGIEVDAGVLYAVGDPPEYDAVDAAIERLEDRVLFARADGTYRTVHEAWSVAFLAHLLDAEGERAAAERFGNCVTALLALADAPGQREEIAHHLDGRWTLAAVADDPQGWADETVEAMYTLGEERPKLAPLFGDGDHDSVTLPDACSAAVADERSVWLGRMFVAGGFYDRAERAFDRLPRDDAAFAVERLLGLARVATNRSEYDDAIAHAEACLAVGDETDEPDVRARAELAIGRALERLSDFEDARDRLRNALDRFEAVGDRRRTATTLDELGVVAWRLAEYETAREYHRRSLELSRELGDRRGETASLTYLGIVAKEQDDYDAAREYYERSLEIDRRLGDRDGVAQALDHLGLVARHQGDFETAREYHHRALEINRDIGDRNGEVRSLGNLGLIAMEQSDFEAAREYFERTLDVQRELGVRHDVAKSLGNLGEVAVGQGEYDAAREYLQEGLAIFREMGDRRGEAITVSVLGVVAREQGEYEQAREYLKRGIDCFQAVGVPRGEAESRHHLGMVLAEQGDVDRAREAFETAVETFESVGAPQDALATLKSLVEIYREGDDPEEALARCRRAEELLVEAPAPVADEHREWVQRHLRELDD